MPRSKIIPIAQNTFLESVRDRVLYNLLVFVLMIVAVSVVLGRVAIGQEVKMIIDVGLSAMTFFGALIAIFIGIGLVNKEIERRTLDTILSKPVHRYELIIGKYLGLAMTLAVNCLVMVFVIHLAMIFETGGIDTAHLNLWPAAYLIYLELAIVTSVALLFSSFSSPALSATLTFLIFLIGRWGHDLKSLAENSDSIFTGAVSRLFYHVVPNLANFNYIDQTAHGRTIPAGLLGWNSLYAVFYVAALVAAAIVIFEKRDFK